MKKSILLSLFILLCVSCLQQNIPSQLVKEIPLSFKKSVDIDVAVATCKVTADDMDTIQVALRVTSNEITGTIPSVPYGDNRLFEIFCYNSAGAMNYYGSVTVNINSSSPVVNLVLYPYNQEADVTIIGTFGDVEESDVKVVFVADWNGNYDVYMMNVDGNDLEQISFSTYNANCPILSPDRKKVVYQRPSEVGHQGFIIDLTTLNETMLPLVEYSPHHLCWHPTENKLIFWSTIHGSSDAFEYNMDTDSVTCLIQDPSRIWGARYTPDGNNILYHSDINGVFRAFMANSDGSQQVQLFTKDNVEERTIRMHPENSNLFLFAGRGYSSSSYVQWGLFVNDIQNDSVSCVISNTGIDETRPVWSPNGDMIIYERRDNVGYGIYLIKPDGTENSVLIDREGNERYPFWR